MNNNSKGTAMSWISDSEDDSDIGEGEGTKKSGEKEFKKNEAIIPDLIVNNGTKDSAEEMDESGQKTPAEKEKEMPTKETEELAESPPIDPSAAKEDNKDEELVEGFGLGQIGFYRKILPKINVEDFRLKGEPFILLKFRSRVRIEQKINTINVLDLIIIYVF